MSIDIKNDCFVEGINFKEFISYLRYRSGGSTGSYDSDGNYIVTYSPPLIGRNDIKVVYGKKHQIKSILFSGTNKTIIKPFIDQAHSILNDKSNLGVHYSILFSKGRPINGYYRNHDYNFQILELPESSIQPETLLEDHPFIIQYSYYITGNTMIDAQRRSDAANKWELFCVGIFDGLITKPTQSRRWVWGIEDHQSWTKIAQDGYYLIDEYEKDDLGFFKPQNELSISKINVNQYFNALRTIGTELMLPENIDHLVSKFTQLDYENEDIFLRSSYWLLQSGLTISNSLSYTALAFSLETLVPESEKVSTCPTCKTEDLSNKVHESVSNQIRTLINEYIEIPEDLQKKLFNKLYSLRSKIAHGDHLFCSDNSFSTSMDSRYLDESDSYQILRKIVKLILYNWFVKI